MPTTARPAFPLQAVTRPASGVLVGFAAFGFAGWFSGLASWIAFYLGFRAGGLALVAQATAVAGFLLGAAGAVAWYARRCRRSEPAGVPPRVALAACLALPLGGICWAVFVDAIAWRYGQDVVRPAFDNAILYPVLVGLPLLAVAVPALASRLVRPLPGTTRWTPGKSVLQCRR
jgi:hypothetical protein